MPASAVTITFGVASSMRVARLCDGEAAEHHRVDGAEAHAWRASRRPPPRSSACKSGRDRPCRRRAPQDRGEAVNFGEEFRVGIDLLLVDLGRDVNQRLRSGASARAGRPRCSTDWSRRRRTTSRTAAGCSPTPCRTACASRSTSRARARTRPAVRSTADGTPCGVPPISISLLGIV